MKNYFLTIALLSSTLVSAANRPQGIDQAEAALMNGDVATMLAETRQALMTSKNHPLVVRFAADLLKTAKAKGIMQDSPITIALPSEVTYLGLDIQRRYKTQPGTVQFGLNAAVGVIHTARVEQFQVIRYPDQVVLDMAAGIGHTELETTDDGNEVWMGGAQSARMVEEGLYLVNFKLVGSPMVKGYAVITGKNSSASPVIMRPALSDELSDTQPVISWKKFRSPEHGENEKVILNVIISDVDTDKDIMIARLKDTNATSFKVGDVAAARFYQGVKELVPGKYRLRIAVREADSADKLFVRRSSTTVVPFSIK